MDYLDWILDGVLSLDGIEVYLLAFGFAFVETAIGLGFVVPGELGMLFSGIVASQNEMSLGLLIALGVLGATLGDSTSYWLGRRYGERLIERTGPLRRYLEPRLERARGHFADRGGAAVVTGRFIAALRAVIPAVAGISGMPFTRFLPWNLAASLVWASVVISIGWVFSAAIVSAFEAASGWIALGAIVLFLGYEIISWRRHRDTSD